MRPDRPAFAAGKRLDELAKSRRVSLAALSRMIGRAPPYLATFVRDARPPHLDDRDVADLAAFFDVDPWELGKRHGT